MNPNEHDAIATERERANCINNLKKISERPVVLYGAGFYAEELASFLVSLGIKVSDYVVDLEFLNKILEFCKF